MVASSSSRRRYVVTRIVGLDVDMMESASALMYGLLHDTKSGSRQAVIHIVGRLAWLLVLRTAGLMLGLLLLRCLHDTCMLPHVMG